MRAFSPAMVLSLATMSMWLGWPIDQAQAQMPGACQVQDCQPMMAPGACMPQGQCMPPEYAGQAQCPGRMGIYDGPCDAGACGPRFTFAAEAIALQRSTTRSQTLLQDVSRNDLLNSKDLNFPVAFGPKVSAIWHNPCDIGWDLEVAYFQVDGFAASAFMPGTSYIVADSSTRAVVTDATVDYTSRLYNGELNVRQQCCDWLTLFSGFRMLQLNEQYNATGTQQATPIVVTDNTFNHLYGFQLGADAEFYNMGGPLTINALCKAGIYQNYASQTLTRSAGSVESLSAVRDHAAFLGEVGIVAHYAITQHLAFRASYEAMWLEGVALAPEQIGATNFATSTATCDTAGGVFYHGGGVGLEYRF